MLYADVPGGSKAASVSPIVDVHVHNRLDLGKVLGGLVKNRLLLTLVVFPSFSAHVLMRL